MIMECLKHHWDKYRNVCFICRIRRRDYEKAQGIKRSKNVEIRNAVEKFLGNTKLELNDLNPEIIDSQRLLITFKRKIRDLKKNER